LKARHIVDGLGVLTQACLRMRHARYHLPPTEVKPAA
jgi:hypothetical protein